MLNEEGGAVESVLEKEVAGEYTTFRVYLYVFKRGEASPRQVHQKLGLSSPSLALHHLEKLRRLGLVSKDEHGKYHGVRRKFGVLRFFVATGKWVDSRTFFYMIFYILTAVGSLLMLLRE
jgi:DNA-binding transcriptional ArsR family regulator